MVPYKNLSNSHRKRKSVKKRGEKLVQKISQYTFFRALYNILQQLASAEIMDDRRKLPRNQALEKQESLLSFRIRDNQCEKIIAWDIDRHMRSPVNRRRK